MSTLIPKEIVAELDRYIVGQDEAKRVVAIALRNRYRRSMLDKSMRDEITPKNIIMVGPTGVGKTEIARRLARLMDAPFVKVEATKFTEVGYVGRDVDSMIRDLVEAAIRLVKNRKEAAVRLVAQANAEQRLVSVIIPAKRKERRASNPIEALFGGGQQEEPLSDEEEKALSLRRGDILTQLREGKLEDNVVEIEVVEQNNVNMLASMGMDVNMNDLFGGILPKKTKKRKATVRDARKIIEQEETDKLIDMDEVTREAIEKAEQHGIIFLDEIDKIAGRNMGSGPDVSREGVQRDILPIVEGSTVATKYGPVKTDYMLFIAAGAFHVAKVSDLIPELQGRFPIRVELKPLTKIDFERIMTQPENAITKQYQAMLAVDNVKLTFKDDALVAIADFAFKANETQENIGARRLHTVVEKMLEDISFNAGGNHPEVEVVIDEAYVHEHLTAYSDMAPLDRFVL